MTGSGSFGGFLDRAVAQAPQRPWSRVELDLAGWQALLVRLETTPDWSLIGLWAEPTLVHMGLRDDFDRRHRRVLARGA